MISQKKLKSITDFILCKSNADQTEVVILNSDFALTRFANNQIHQNLVRQESHVSVRVIKEKKIGVAIANSLEKNILEKTLAQALELAQNQKPDPDFASLPKPTKYSIIKSFYGSTAIFTPKQRAQKILNVIKIARSKDFKSFGALSTQVIETAVANSHGLWTYFPQTIASFNTTIMSSTSSGWASSLNSDIKKINIEEEARKSAAVAFIGQKPKTIKTGYYKVVLAPSAVNELLLYLAYLGFGARAFHEGRSFLSGKIGKKVMSEKITIYDDGLDTDGIPIPFDFEGFPKKKTILIKKGIAQNVVYDSYLANKYHQKNTGHALPAPNTLDALATHLHLVPCHSGGVETSTEPTCPATCPAKSWQSGKLQRNGGDPVGKKEKTFLSGFPSPDEQSLISKVKKGLFISRFWYVNAHHHKTLTVTGLTRDGTFMIENGQIVYPVKNLRFTQSIPEAFSVVQEIGKDVKIMESWLGANQSPALRIEKFNFTGISKNS